MRVIVAELQKISGGRRQAGVALHYRLGFQLLAEDPELFFDLTCPTPAGLKDLPIAYRGGELRFGVTVTDVDARTGTVRYRDATGTGTGTGEATGRFAAG